MNLVFHTDLKAASAVEEAGFDVKTISRRSLDGVGSEVMLMLGSAALSLRAITEIVRILAERKNQISMSLDGNEYLNVDKETALEVIRSRHDRELPGGDENSAG